MPNTSPQQQNSPAGKQGQNEGVFASLPSVDMWPDLSYEERERRAAVLEDIKRRICENGPHVAKPSPERARQFMPFAALKGYDSLTDAVEHEINGQ